MLRVNLLPREIIEKRKFERYLGFVVLGGFVAILVVLGVWGILAINVSSKNATLQQDMQTAAQLSQQADAYSIFEQKEETLKSREAVARQALDRRIDWGRLMNEFSLILPSDVWAVNISAAEDTGLNLDLIAVDSSTDVPDVGHKTVAKTLVRLADLEQVENVWLLQSTKGFFLDGEDGPMIQFQVSSSVVRPPAEATATASVPAPPSPAQ